MDNRMAAEHLGRSEKVTVGRKLNNDFTKLTSDLLRITDIAIVVGCGLLSYLAYVKFSHQNLREDYFRAICVAGFLAVPVLEWSRLYREPRLRNAVRSAGPIFLGCGALFCLMLIIGFAAHSLNIFSRLWAATWLVATGGMLVAERFAVQALVRRLESKGVLREAIAIVGSGPLVDRLVAYLQGLDQSPVEIVGIF